MRGCDGEDSVFTGAEILPANNVINDGPRFARLRSKSPFGPQWTGTIAGADVASILSEPDGMLQDDAVAAVGTTSTEHMQGIPIGASPLVELPTAASSRCPTPLVSTCDQMHPAYILQTRASHGYPMGSSHCREFRSMLLQWWILQRLPHLAMPHRLAISPLAHCLDPASAWHHLFSRLVLLLT